MDGTYQNGGVAGKSDGTQGIKLSGSDSSQHHFNGNDKGNAAGKSGLRDLA